jgi:hypothetical protein
VPLSASVGRELDVSGITTTYWHVIDRIGQLEQRCEKVVF